MLGKSRGSETRAPGDAERSRAGSAPSRSVSKKSAAIPPPEVGGVKRARPTWATQHSREPIYRINHGLCCIQLNCGIRLDAARAGGFLAQAAGSDGRMVSPASPAHLVK